MHRVSCVSKRVAVGAGSVNGSTGLFYGFSVKPGTAATTLTLTFPNSQVVTVNLPANGSSKKVLFSTPVKYDKVAGLSYVVAGVGAVAYLLYR